MYGAALWAAWHSTQRRAVNADNCRLILLLFSFCAVQQCDMAHEQAATQAAVSLILPVAAPASSLQSALTWRNRGGNYLRGCLLDLASHTS